MPLRRKTLLETSAIIVGYAMSRLDRLYLKSRRIATWNEAYAQAAKALQVAPASLKNLRDEFDPFHGNPRRGWINRPMRPNRQRVMGELCDVSDAAILKMVEGLLNGATDILREVVAPLSKSQDRVQNVVERLRTGRLAEAFFQQHCREIVGVEAARLLDHRELFQGYDFGIHSQPEIAIEVKGLKQKRGSIAFTDREWREGLQRRQNYWLVVVGNLIADPSARLIRDPTSSLRIQCSYRTSIVASWHATVSTA
ncbi:MAG TPA: DUF3883 domain-containing protein [Gemmataceae bacterium]|jgi:hypothetical protein